MQDSIFIGYTDTGYPENLDRRISDIQPDTRERRIILIIRASKIMIYNASSRRDTSVRASMFN